MGNRLPYDAFATVQYPAPDIGANEYPRQLGGYIGDNDHYNKTNEDL